MFDPPAHKDVQDIILGVTDSATGHDELGASDEEGSFQYC